MSGRAGRYGLDDSGDSILMCTPASETHGRFLLAAACEPVNSALHCDLCRFLLELVCASHSTGRKCVLGAPAGSDTTCIADVIKQSLWGLQSQPEDTLGGLTLALDQLTRHGIVEVNGEAYTPTPKGLAVFRSGVSVEDAGPLLAELTAANDRIVLSDPTHVIFLLVSHAAAICDMRHVYVTRYMSHVTCHPLPACSFRHTLSPALQCPGQQVKNLPKPDWRHYHDMYCRPRTSSPYPTYSPSSRAVWRHTVFRTTLN